MNKRFGWGLAIFSVLIFSTNTPVARTIIVEGGMNPVTLVAARFISASIIFGIMMATTTLGHAKEGQHKLNKRVVAICLASGGLNGVTMCAFYIALQYIEASLTSVLGIALFPMFTLLLLRTGGEALTPRKLLRVGVTLVGLYFLIGINGEINITGVLFVLLAASTYAIHLVSVQWYMHNYNTWAKTSIMMTGSAIVVFFLWLFYTGGDTFVAGWQGWLVLAYQGIVLTVIGRTATYTAVNYIGSAQMALLTPVETVLTIIWSVLFLNERLSPTQTIGAAFILVSALLAAEFRKTKKDVLVVSAENN